jgi:PAS domain S-box-containing protein
VVVFALLVVSLAPVERQWAHESPSLLLGLNLVRSLVALVSAGLIGLSFLRRPAAGLLLFGAGVLAWGLSGLFVILLGFGHTVGKQLDYNLAVTVNNLCVLLSALLHLSGAVVAPRENQCRRFPRALLATAYGCTLAMAGLISWEAMFGLTPQFFIQGQGGTLAREFVLGSSAGIFVLTGIMLETRRRRRELPTFMGGYVHCLFFFGIGLFGVWLVKTSGSALSWAGRGAQCVGTFYLLSAALKLARHSGGKEWRMEMAINRGQYRYQVAVVMVALAIAVRLALLQRLGNTAPFVTFYPCVMIAALYGGTRAGSLATALSAAAAEIFWVRDGGRSISIQSNDWLLQGLFVGSCLMISWVSGAVQRARTRALRAETRAHHVEVLRASEKRYRSLFENNLDPIFSVDSLGRFLSANPAAEALSGYSIRELLEMNFAQLCVPERLEATMADFLASLQTQQPWFETAMRRKDGRRVELIATGVPVRRGADTTLFCIARDITAHKREERAGTLTMDLLSLANASTSTGQFVGSTLDFFRKFSGCDAIGIRLREEAGYPCYASLGFPPDFFETQCCANGRKQGQLTPARSGDEFWESFCGMILGEHGAVESLLTPNGTFWSGDLPRTLGRLLALGLRVSQEACFCHGYQSMALIPLGNRGQRSGLLILCSKQSGHFSSDDIELFEQLADKLSIAIVKFQIEETREKALRVMEERVAERTQELKRANEELLVLKDCKEELFRISEREKQTIAREIHDGLCQHLSGTTMMVGLLHRKLVAANSPEAELAKQIEELLRSGTIEARNLSHGLHPIGPEPEALMSALAGLARMITELFQVECRFECEAPVWIQDQAVASHLFRMAQEATNNAVKHGNPRQIRIVLARREQTLVLSIRDDGAGIPEKLSPTKGMGFQILRYRAAEIGATLEIRRDGERGTVVECRL